MGGSEILEVMTMIPYVLSCGRYKLDTDYFISGGSPRIYNEHTLFFSSYKLDTEILSCGSDNILSFERYELAMTVLLSCGVYKLDNDGIL